MPIYLDKVLGSLKENLGLGHYKHWQKKKTLKSLCKWLNDALI